MKRLKGLLCAVVLISLSCAVHAQTEAPATGPGAGSTAPSTPATPGAPGNSAVAPGIPGPGTAQTVPSTGPASQPGMSNNTPVTPQQPQQNFPSNVPTRSYNQANPGTNTQPR